MKSFLLHTRGLLLSFILFCTFGCGNNQPKLPEIPGVKGPLFNVIDGKIMITIKLLRANLNVGAKVPIPKTQESYFEVSPNVEDGGTLVVYYLDIDDLKSMDIGNGDPNTLPDGRPIPGVPGGTLNSSVRLDTELLDMSFYFHQKLFGFYIPLGWDTNGFGGYWNVIIKDKNVGMLGAVASDDDGHGAGFILFLRLEQLKSRELQKLIELSENKPGLMF